MQDSPEAQLVLSHRLHDRTSSHVLCLGDDITPGRKVQRLRDLEKNIADMCPTKIRIKDIPGTTGFQQIGRYAKSEEDYGPTLLDLNEWLGEEDHGSGAPAGAPVDLLGHSEACSRRAEAREAWKSLQRSRNALDLHDQPAHDRRWYHVNADMDLCVGVWLSSADGYIAPVCLKDEPIH